MLKRAVESMTYCEDVSVEEQGAYSLTEQGGSVVLRVPRQLVSCADPERKLLFAMNINGKELEENGIFYSADFNGYYNRELDTNVEYDTDFVETIDYTSRTYLTPGERTYPGVPGTYELVLYTISDGCSGWAYSVNGSRIEHNRTNETRSTYVVKFQGDWLNVTHYETTEGCKLQVYAGELWKINAR